VADSRALHFQMPWLCQYSFPEQPQFAHCSFTAFATLVVRRRALARKYVCIGIQSHASGLDFAGVQVLWYSALLGWQQGLASAFCTQHLLIEVHRHAFGVAV
jgi:hypothetical protein